MTTNTKSTSDPLTKMVLLTALAFGLTLTPKVRLDHAYRLYEYTVYLYRPEAIQEPCTSA